MTTPQQLEEEMLSNPVRSLQYMLRRLAGRYDFLPQLALDGIFGERTLEAVMLFQRELAPPVTGVVDQRTWNAIRDAWIDLERETAPPRTLRIFPGEGYQVEPGMSGVSMILPQTMFQLLRQRLEGIAEGDADGVHGDASVQNTLWLWPSWSRPESWTGRPGICSAGCTSCLSQRNLCRKNSGPPLDTGRRPGF